MLVSLKDIEKSYSEYIILDKINLNIDKTDRIGIVGVNGAGKTTLLNIISKNEEPDTGSVDIKSGLSIGYLKQGSGLSSDNTIMEEMKSAFDKLYKIMDRMKELEAKLSASNKETDEYQSFMEEYSRLSSYFEQRDGYNINVRIKTVLGGMGFSEKPEDTVVSTLSGGEKTRLALAKLLLEEPELLILDEPTNHLDFKTLMWLEDYLNSYKGAILVVSHDRYFLDKIAKTIWEVDQAKVLTYKGNYTKYLALKRERQDREKKEYETAKEKAAKMLEYAQRNIARASTSKSAKSRLKQLANMPMPKKPKAGVKPARFKFSMAKESGKEVLRVSEFSLKIQGLDRVLADKISFDVQKGERLAIIGENGTGKTTLLKALLKNFPSGNGIKWGNGVLISYYDQEGKNLRWDNTLLEELHRRHPLESQEHIRSVLGQVCLTEDNVYKLVSQVSGGERARLSLAAMMLDKANTLILDEPTNHLDLAIKEEIQRALCDFEGTIIFVSHDRYFLNSLPTKILELEDNKARLYKGGFDDYIKAKQSFTEIQVEKGKTEEKPEKKKDTGYRTKEQRKESAKRRAELKNTEKALLEKEYFIKELEEEIASPDTQSDYQRLAGLCEELEKTRNEYEELLSLWMEFTVD